MTTEQQVTHTPGPWVYCGCGKCGNVYAPEAGSGGIDIARALDEYAPESHDTPAPNPQVKVANARLIAAAPDLLKALEALTDAYLTIPGMSGLPLPNAEAYHQALAAIRKARGESS